MLSTSYAFAFATLGEMGSKLTVIIILEIGTYVDKKMPIKIGILRFSG